MSAAEGDSAVMFQRSALAAGPHTSRATASATGTNVQEAGVDEPDQVKTDGELLVRVHAGDAHDVRRHRARPGRARLARPAGLPGRDAELLLVGDRAVVLGSAPAVDGRASTTVPSSSTWPTRRRPSVRLQLDLRHRAGQRGAARRHRAAGADDAAARPRLRASRTAGAGRRPGGRSAATARWSARRTLDDWLPHVTTGTPGGTTAAAAGLRPGRGAAGDDAAAARHAGRRRPRPRRPRHHRGAGHRHRLDRSPTSRPTASTWPRRRPRPGAAGRSGSARDHVPGDGRRRGRRDPALLLHPRRARRRRTPPRARSTASSPTAGPWTRSTAC